MSNEVLVTNVSTGAVTRRDETALEAAARVTRKAALDAAASKLAAVAGRAATVAAKCRAHAFRGGEAPTAREVSGLLAFFYFHVGAEDA